MLEFRDFENLTEFYETIWPTLSNNIMPNNMLLGFVDFRRNNYIHGPNDRFAAIFENGIVAGAIYQDKAGRPIFSDMKPDTALFAMNHWLRANGTTTALFGPETPINALLNEFQTKNPTWVPQTMPMWSYELTQVTLPEIKPPGRMRFAENSDEDLLVEWSIRFIIDCKAPEANSKTLREDTQKNVAKALANRARVLWEIDNKPVAMAGSGRKASFGTSVGSVYTPPNLRGHGYASQLVAELSQHLLDTGAPRCLLFTDAANPTSNKIYQRMGYRRCCDFLLIQNVPQLR
jgi:RimJ/RimL family protein N-acetyltransferase